MRSLADIGAALVQARKDSGLSQARLAERVGVHRQQLQRWESSGYRSTSLERVDAVARALGFDALVIDGSIRLTRTGDAVGPSEGTAIPVRELGDVVARVRAYGDELHELYGVKKLGVFGSFADARQTAESDVDCLVEFDEPGTSTADLAEFLHRVLGRKVDVTTLERLRWEIRADVSREVVRVWAA